jgi:hypothetical protein
VYQRARYYDGQTGEFTSQDPLEYVDGMSLYRGYFVPRGADPTGLLTKDDIDDVIQEFEEKVRNGGDHHYFDPEILWRRIILRKFYEKYKYFWSWDYVTTEYEIFQTGCMGVASCMAGWEPFSMTEHGDCFSSLKGAQTRQAEMAKNGDCCSLKGSTLIRGSDVIKGSTPLNSKPVIIGYTWTRGRTPVFDNNGRVIEWKESTRAPRYDFGFYDPDLDAFFHAEDTFRLGNRAIISKPTYFHNYHGLWKKTVYCVVCSGASPVTKYGK